MVCIVNGGTVVYGPAPWNLSSVMGVLVVSGFDVLDGIIIGPNGKPIVQAPVDNLDGPLPLADGFAVLPAVEVDEPAPDGQALAGQEKVILEDRVELRPVWADIPPPPPPPSLEEVKVAKKEAIEAERVRREYTTLRATFPDGVASVQTRDERDYRNILATVNEAVKDKALGKAEGKAYFFKDAANVVHAMNADQCIAFGESVKACGDAIVSFAWLLKGDVDAYTEDTPENIAAVYGIDHLAGWPDVH